MSDNAYVPEFKIAGERRAPHGQSRQFIVTDVALGYDESITWDLRPEDFGSKPGQVISEDENEPYARIKMPHLPSGVSEATLTLAATYTTWTYGQGDKERTETFEVTVYRPEI